jgi:Uma2 family endonuclease
MATGTLVSVGEYLRTAYSPDCEFEDGEVIERNLGERDHSRTQLRLIHRLLLKYPDLVERLLPEQRVQINHSRFRVPDLCLLKADAPWEPIVQTAPLLCIEILSPEDRMPRVLAKLEEYFSIGVLVCWVLDPETRQGWVATPEQLTPARDGVLACGEISIELADIFQR